MDKWTSRCPISPARRLDGVLSGLVSSVASSTLVGGLCSARRRYEQLALKRDQRHLAAKIDTVRQAK